MKTRCARWLAGSGTQVWSNKVLGSGACSVDKLQQGTAVFSEKRKGPRGRGIRGTIRGFASGTGTLASH